jgi:hypothetical protein
MRAVVNEIWYDYEKWINVAQDAEQRQALVKTVVKCLVPEKAWMRRIP